MARRISITCAAFKAVAAMVLLCFSACSADVVKGTVSDSTSNQAIANVLVQEAGTGNVTLTDAHGRFTLEINAAIVRPRDGKSPNSPAPEPSAPAIVSRKGGFATRWTSVALGDTNLTFQLDREVETAGPSAALFANPYYVCLRNFYVAPPPGGNDANDGTSPQSPWATFTKANVGRLAGDCVNLGPGIYKLTGAVAITSGGNASTPAGYVVYRSTRMGAAHLVAAARFNHMVRITAHHVMFDGIDFDGNNFMAGLCGLDVEQSLNYHHSRVGFIRNALVILIGLFPPRHFPVLRVEAGENAPDSQRVELLFRNGRRASSAGMTRWRSGDHMPGRVSIFPPWLTGGEFEALNDLICILAAENIHLVAHQGGGRVAHTYHDFPLSG